ncbi:MAG: asparagine synthase-related protein [Pseudomonadota bacterium]
MTIFAGVVTMGNVRPNPGAAREMLSYVVAPLHDRVEQFGDEQIDFAAQLKQTVSDFYVDEKICVASCNRIDDLEGLRERVSLPADEQNTAKILAFAYRKWGEDLVRKITGEFAFAIWNRTDRSLFCGRDRFGQIPFAYMVTPNGIVFGSDFISVAMATAGPPEINDAWIISRVCGTVLDQDATAFKEVKKLPPASTLHWCEGRVCLRKYWSFAEIEPTGEDIDISELLEALEDAIHRRTAGTQSVAFLSGGLDSSSIAILARDLNQKSSAAPLPSVSLVLDAFPEESERPYIESVLGQGGFEAHLVNLREYDVVSELARYTRIQGAPTRAGAAPIYDQALSKVEQLGFSSVLDGHGGDEVISSFGIMRIFELGNNGEWLTAMREMASLSRHSDLEFLDNYVALLASKGQGLMAKIARRVFTFMRATSDVEPSPSLLRTEWQSHPTVSRAESAIRMLKPSNQKSEREYQERILSDPLQAHNFELQHRICRSRGIRPQIPYWDHKVIDYCLRAPSNQKLKNGVPRSLIRSVMGDRLPSLVANRTTKFDSTEAIVRSFQAKYDQVRQISNQYNHRVYDYLEPNVFQSAVMDLHSDDPLTRQDAANTTWMVLSLFMWFDLLDSYQTQKKDPLVLTC